MGPHPQFRHPWKPSGNSDLEIGVGKMGRWRFETGGTFTLHPKVPPQYADNYGIDKGLSGRGDLFMNRRGMGEERHGALGRQRDPKKRPPPKWKHWFNRCPRQLGGALRVGPFLCDV